MGKHKKNKSMTASVEKSSAGAVKAQIKKFNWKRALVIALSTIAAFAFYEVLIAIPALRVGGIPIIMPIYLVVIAVLLCAIFILNSGISQKPVTPDMLRTDDNEDEAELQEICERINARKAKAKKLMLILLPFLLAVLFDTIYLFYGDFFKGAIEALFGA